MITTKEINSQAGLHGLKDTQIEKDYVLSWILYGISVNETLFKVLVFKGGTVLKKVYFENYRFSEDLDFTLVNESLTNDQLLAEFEKVYAFVKKQANMDLQFKNSEVHKSGSIAFYIDYVGPLQSAMGNRDVKVDITRGEKMEYDIEIKKLFVPYSDLPGESYVLQCYTLSEVLIEKMAALMGRTEPRDLFDFWYLTEIEGMDVRQYKSAFESKAKHKEQDPEKFAAKVLAKEKNLKAGWERKLKNQVKQLDKFDDVFRESKRHFKW